MQESHGTGALKQQEKFTLKDWRSLPSHERWELVNGTAYNMSPAPKLKHQEIVFSLARKLGNFLEGKSCKVFIAPVDVFLEEHLGDDASVVEPDVLVVCDSEKLKDDGVHGAPDFIAEIVSEGTAHKDFGQKRDLYERAGVREYWIINPENGTVYQYIRNKDCFEPVREYRKGTALTSALFPHFSWMCE